MENIFKFWKSLLFNPKEFFKNEFTNYKINYFPIAIIIFGIANGIDRLDSQFVKFDLKGNLDDINFLNNWLPYWCFAILGGMIGGYILYLIGGWFYNVRVKWSKGTGNIDKSRNLYLYSNFYVSLIIILIAIILTIKDPLPYNPNADISIFEVIYIPTLLFFVFHSIHLSFIGVTNVTDVDFVRARIWFLVLPIVYYLVVYSAMVVILYNYFSY